MNSLRSLLRAWSDWTGDKRLTDAIHAELRRLGYGVSAAKTRDVRLAAVQRPGWVQVYRFRVETTAAAEIAPEGESPRRGVLLFGVSRDDGRRPRIEVLLTEDEALWRQRLAEWSEGLITRG